ncbi:DUF1553 domain-containing protein [Lacipirellula parvula]|uniref:DUF1553 domain-containing protein n=1 Tax=Lacipirellula parvula TaxID=2650471 RepID=UPI001E48AAC3|nr:DUF1553 domain-containing protein [Lacipirellula parvula]
MLRTCLIAVAALLTGGAASGAKPDFDRDIRPILSDKCFFCHGPDGERREAELRLDTRAGAIESVVVAGDPDGSELIARITSDDESLRMPPVESNLALTAAEKQLLHDWIAAGAEYTEHWAFLPLPAEVPLPKVTHADWPHNEIDRFILARLEAEELSPAERANPLRLLRRLSLDLTGLPPKPADIAAFETAVAADGLDAALHAAVERLLASPAFGEHLAVAWLDAARYADSFGYQSDQLNTQWPYRDWVVRAFNDNLPYDQFLTWQLAGDLLENPTRDQILATAFNRMHRMTNEGGSIAEEWLVENAADRVHTFGSAMLGLTLECSRCHDHKYDPILARDYYSISAFFNSIDENGMYDHSAKVPSPTLLLPTAEQERELANAATAVRNAEQHLADVKMGGSDRLAAWRATNSPPSKGREQPSTLASGERAQGGSLEESIPDATSPVGGSATTENKNPSPNPSLQGRGTIPDLVAHFTFDDKTSETHNANGLPQVPGRAGQAIRCDGDHGVTFPDLLKIDRPDPFTLDLWLRDVLRNPQPVVVAQRTFGTDVGYNGFDLMLADGVLEARLYRVWPGNAIGVRAAEPIAAADWEHITVTYDGSSRAAGLRLYLNGRELQTTILRDKIQKSVAVSTYGSGTFTLGERFRDRGFKDGEFDELRLYARALTPYEITLLHDDATASDDQVHNDAARRDYYFSAHDAPARAAAEKLRDARRQLVASQEAIHEVSVMDELPEPRPAYILPRGAYDAPKTDETRVTRDVFSEMLPPFPADAPRNRLGLARWLTAPNHPLTARVFVNRLWANFFGHGLSTTPDNFGRQGTAPTHPELLDWLARDFVAHGWDVKRLCRQIVSSAAYQQDSRTTPELRERDPENLLLARGPSRRLSAEQIRDLALAAGELLVDKPGGPPVYPYQPGGDLWRESNGMSPAYTQSTGEGLRRRSLYSVWKRTAPLPNMLVFDATSREVCTISRGRTNTPLQALVLLNDVQFVEAARALASAVAKQHAGPRDRIAAAFLRLAGRAPNSAELALLTDLYQEQLASFSTGSDGAGAAQLTALGETKADEAIPPNEFAALTVTCQAILNLDATIYER